MRLLLLVLWCSVAAANPAPTRLDPMTHSVLWGRFSLQLPAGMRVVPNPADSSGLTMPRGIAARAVLDEDHGRFVMTAMDTLTFLDGDFVSAVKIELAANRVAIGDEGRAIYEVKRRGFRIVLVEPVLPRNATDSNLVHVAYVKTQGQEVIAFGFYVFGDGLRAHAESWAGIAQSAMLTLEDAGGSSSLEIAGSMMAGERTLSVTVPNRWYVFGLHAGQLRTEGLLLRERVALGSPARSCSIDRSLSTSPGRVTTAPARWLDKQGTWRVWPTKTGHQAEIEVKVGDARVRAWCTAPTVGGLREARRIVGEMTLH